MNISLRAAIAALGIIYTASASAADANFGYCTDNINRNNIFRLGASEKQGMAIRLSHEKLQALKGRTITGISAAFGSSRTTGSTASLFIATSLDAQPITEQTSAIASAVKWLSFPLDNAYTITGDEPELFIGYTADISVNASLLLADAATDSKECCYAISNGEWVDTYGLGFGNASIRIEMADAPDFTDMMVKPISTEGYFKAEHEYTLEAQVFNFGTTTIESFDLDVAFGGSNVATIPLTGISIKPNETFDITLPDIQTEQEGAAEMTVTLLNINGGADATPADNQFAQSVFFYPAAMERSILLEGFTGQKCSNCPSGHATIDAFLNSGVETPIIEVMHHAGYQPDRMTMDADLEYTRFYGSSSTFAPAMMMNRALYSSLANVPVLNVSESLLRSAYAIAEKSQPYASLSLETTYDADTRTATVAISVHAHADMPAEMNVLNVMLVQDGIVASQTPYGDGYVHDAVFRGAVTGNAWGLLISDNDAKAGADTKWTHTFTVPEYIFSDYWNWDDLDDDTRLYYSTETEIEKMRVVAYVGAFNSTNLADNYIYNCTEAKLGESHSQGGFTSVSDVIAPESIEIRVIDGQIVADGCDSLTVFTLDSRMVCAHSPLAPGIYVARATKGNTSSVKKIRITY